MHPIAINYIVAKITKHPCNSVRVQIASLDELGRISAIISAPKYFCGAFRLELRNPAL